MTSRMMEDGRTIHGITNEALGQDIVFIGRGGVTRIECYEEPGQGACVPWFAVWKGQEISRRISSVGPIGVHYVTSHIDRRTE